MANKIDVEQKSRELKEFVGQFKSDQFISELAYLLTLVGDGPIPYQPFHLLHSPMRQLYYLGALNITSEINQNNVAYEFKPEIWMKIIRLLNEIDKGYDDLFIDKTKIADENELEKIKVALPTFLNYYNTGPINFEEQEIERIEKYFSPFRTEIENQFGLTLNDFIGIYNEIDEILYKQLNKILTLKNNPECEEFWIKMRQNNIRPNDWKNTGNKDIDELILLMKDQSEKLKISPATIESMKDPQKAELFFKTLSCERKTGDNYLFYTYPNIWLEKPVFRLEDGRYLIVQIKQIIHGIFYLLFNFCKSIDPEKLYKTRGNELELKIERVFRDYFGKEALIFREYKTKTKKGQDVLIIYRDLVLIIEAKSTKRDAPSWNIETAYKQIISNFSESLQYAYDQSFRVKELFLKEREIEILNKKGNLIHTVRTKNIHNVFSIIVTLEKFGQIQTDLGLLLEIYDVDSYPWSISIDDLEVFLLTMKKYNRKKIDLIRFLNQREQLHCQVICTDELEICGEFIRKKNLPILKENEIYETNFEMTNIFEKQYEEGMGFDKEKQMERKNNKTHFVFHPHKLAGVARSTL